MDPCKTSLSRLLIIRGNLTFAEDTEIEARDDEENFKSLSASGCASEGEQNACEQARLPATHMPAYLPTYLLGGLPFRVEASYADSC